jgi:hypothetical protein
VINARALPIIDDPRLQSSHDDLRHQISTWSSQDFFSARSKRNN